MIFKAAICATNNPTIPYIEATRDRNGMNDRCELRILKFEIPLCCTFAEYRAFEM